MTIYEQAEKMYEGKTATLAEDIDYYSKHHTVFITPFSILLARLEDEYWFIHLAIGVDCLPHFMANMPIYRPFVAWSRRDKAPKIYSTEKLKRLIL